MRGRIAGSSRPCPSLPGVGRWLCAREPSGFAAPPARSCWRSAAHRTPLPVDVELVLAVDVSYSMDPEEQALQREGYMAAHHLARIPAGAEQGMHGRIAMTYFEWAGSHHQQIIVPWRRDRRAGIGRRLCRRHRARALHAGLAHLDLGRRCCSARRCSTAAAIAASAG